MDRYFVEQVPDDYRQGDIFEHVLSVLVDQADAKVVRAHNDSKLLRQPNWAP